MYNVVKNVLCKKLIFRKISKVFFGSQISKNLLVKILPIINPDQKLVHLENQKFQ